MQQCALRAGLKREGEEIEGGEVGGIFAHIKKRQVKEAGLLLFGWSE